MFFRCNLKARNNLQGTIVVKQYRSQLVQQQLVLKSLHQLWLWSKYAVGIVGEHVKVGQWKMRSCYHTRQRLSLEAQYLAILRFCCLLHVQMHASSYDSAHAKEKASS